MKHLLLFFTGLFLCTNLWSQERDAKAFTLEAFDELRKNNLEWFNQRTPDSLDMVMLFREIGTQLNEKESDQFKKIMNEEFISKTLREIPKRLSRSFEESRNRVLDWEAIEVHPSDMKIDIVQIPGKNDKVVSLKNSYEVSLPFEDEDNHYAFKIDGVRKSERSNRFLVFNNRISVSVTPKNAKIEEITETIQIDDVDEIAEEIVIEEAPPMPPSKVESKKVIPEPEIDLAPPIIEEEIAPLKPESMKQEIEAPKGVKYPESVNKVYEFVEQPPQFPGGESELMRHLSSKIEYPQKALSDSIRGKVMIQFVVNKKGEVRRAKIVKDIGGGCGAEALRVVKRMPKWIPGIQNGKAVNAYFTLPIEFEFQ